MLLQETSECCLRKTIIGKEFITDSINTIAESNNNVSNRVQVARIHSPEYISKQDTYPYSSALAQTLKPHYFFIFLYCILL